MGNADKNKDAMITKIKAALAIGSPFESSDKPSSNTAFVVQMIVLETNRLFGRKSIVFQSLSDRGLDAIILLSKMQQLLSVEEIREVTKNQLLVVTFQGEFDQKQLAEQIRIAFQNLKNNASTEVCTPVALNDQETPITFFVASVDYRVAPWQTASVGNKQTTQIADTAELRSPSFDRLELLESSVDSTRQESLFAVAELANAASSFGSKDLKRLALKLEKLQQNLGLVFVDGDDGSIVQIRKRFSEKLFRPIEVRGIEHLANAQYQSHKNKLGTQLISLIPDDDVSKMAPNEFFAYVDLIHGVGKHREQLVRQFSKWLNCFTSAPKFGGAIESEKQAFVEQLKLRLATLNLVLCCPAANCDSLVSLTTGFSGKATELQFQFTHFGKDRSRHICRKALPRLKVKEFGT